jgi:hypothetical protein
VTTKEMQPKAQEAFERLKTHCAEKRGLGRLYYLKALAQLGNDWHDSREVEKQVRKWNVHNNYLFELGRMYPELVEISPERRVRSRITGPSALELIDEAITSLREDSIE